MTYAGEDTREPVTGQRGKSPGGGARRREIVRPATIFAIMFAVNAVNYLDRFLVVAVGPTLKTQFHLPDRDIGVLGSAFLLVYTLAAVPLGLLADRVSRARVVAVAVGIWSVASTATSIVRGFSGLLLTRALVGIGEAGYYPAGTALLSAYYPLAQRARIMSRWSAGQLVGLALAFALSAGLAVWLGLAHAWRVAFLLTGPPGLLLALLMWRVADAPPEQLAESSVYAADATEASASRSLRQSLIRGREHLARVLRIRTLWLVIGLQALYFIVATPAITFLPIYLRSGRGPFRLGSAETSLLAGAMIVLGGLCGVLLGGNLSDWLSPRARGGRILAAAVGFGLALPCYALMLLTDRLPVFVLAGTLAVLALNIQAGPLTAAVQDATPAALRASAVAVTFVCSHLLGDVWASSAVGSLSTRLHEHSGQALLIVGVPALVVATLLAVGGAGYYAGEVASPEAARC
jgi:sugar phosphate permease